MRKAVLLVPDNISRAKIEIGVSQWISMDYIVNWALACIQHDRDRVQWSTFVKNGPTSSKDCFWTVSKIDLSNMYPTGSIWHVPSQISDPLIRISYKKVSDASSQHSQQPAATSEWEGKNNNRHYKEVHLAFHKVWRDSKRADNGAFCLEPRTCWEVRSRCCTTPDAFTASGWMKKNKRNANTRGGGGLSSNKPVEFIMECNYSHSSQTPLKMSDTNTGPHLPALPLHHCRCHPPALHPIYIWTGAHFNPLLGNIRAHNWMDSCKFHPSLLFLEFK